MYEALKRHALSYNGVLAKSEDEAEKTVTRTFLRSRPDAWVLNSRSSNAERSLAQKMTTAYDTMFNGKLVKQTLC
jgi:hypothetical protein